MAAVLKTAERKLRGFESLPLRLDNAGEGAREVEWGRLLSG